MKGNPKILQTWGSLFYCIFYTVTVSFTLSRLRFEFLHLRGDIGAVKHYVMVEAGDHSEYYVL